MNYVVAVRYIDAVYFKRGEKIPNKNFDFKPHAAVGKIHNLNTHITLSFSWDERNNPEEGLVLPKKSLILEDTNISSPVDLSNLSKKEGSTVGLHWEDIIHFEDGEIPEKPTLMYTEGNLAWVSDSSIAIEKPNTVKIKNQVSNHPKEETVFCVIPKSLIADTKIYE